MSASPISLSVVTPCYNQEEFLETALRSVLDQSCPNLEYIVIDDGSTDRSGEIIRRYEEKITKVIRGSNRGFGEALNTGLAQCTGELMAWINSDDFYLPGAFATVARVFSDCPEVDWIAGSSLITDQEGNPTSINAPPGFSKSLFFSGRYLGTHPGWGGRWIPQESVFWRRSLWEKAGAKFLTDRRQYGDFELWSRFWQYSELHILPVPLAAYRCHPETYTARQGKQSVEPCTQIIEASGLGKYRPWEMRWRSRLYRMSKRLEKTFGEPARVLHFNQQLNKWRPETTYVM
jgi:glycosyltransferase involved in cell wall biosynthesis